MVAVVDLAAVIAQVESSSRDEALRFESGLYRSWESSHPEARAKIAANIRSIHACSHDTAKLIACTSWGRYQILGMNLYSPLCGCQVNIFHYVADIDFQRICLEEFLRNKGIYFRLEDILEDFGKRSQFICGYNGPHAVDAYWGAIKRALGTLGGPLPKETCDVNASN